MTRKPLIAVFCATFLLSALLVSAALGAGYSVHLQGEQQLGSAMTGAVLRTVDQDLRSLSAFYNVSFSRPVTLAFASSVEEFQTLGGPRTPSIAVGFTEPQKNLVVISPLSWREDPGRLGNTLLAEASHLVLDERFGANRQGRIPRWLDEGLSSYMSLDWELARVWPEEQKSLPLRYRYMLLTYYQCVAAAQEQQIITRSALRSGKLPALDRLDPLFLGTDTDVRLAYSAGYSFVRYLRDVYGEERLAAFVSRLGGEQTVPEAVRLTYGKPLAVLERDWRASLGKTAWVWGDMRTKIQLMLVTIGIIGIGLLLASAIVRYRRHGPYAHLRQERHLHMSAGRASVVAVAVAFSAVVLPGSVSPALAEPGPRVSVIADSFVPESLQQSVRESVLTDVKKLSRFYAYDYRSLIRVRLDSGKSDLPGFGRGQVLAYADESSEEIVVSPLSWENDPGSLDGVLMHETSHLVLGQKFREAKKELPRWLDEGMAQYVAQTWDFNLDWAAEQERSLQSAIISHRILPLSALDSAFSRPDSVSLAYAESYGFISYLRRTYGENVLRVLIGESTWPGSTLDQISVRVFGAPLETLFAQWQRNLPAPPWWAVLLDNQNFFVILWSLLAVVVILGFTISRFRRRRAYGNMEDEEEDDAEEELENGIRHQFPE